MKIKISKDYSIWEDIRKSDLRLSRQFKSVTSPLEYHRWEEMEVTEEELLELIKQGHAIMINC